MVKRKKACPGENDSDFSVPIPIQSFLWRQSSPFMKPKTAALCEASCVSFERVLVQHILHGLSPSLCEALQSISRWKLIQSAFPHVLHCCAAVLTQRSTGGGAGGSTKGPSSAPHGKFTGNETKLLYTLHWIILDAALECEDNEEPAMRGSTYLHALDSVQLFVYLLAPLIMTVREEDLGSLKLEPGLRLWQPLWEYRQPEVPCFSTPVKAKRKLLKAQRNLKVNFNTANIYIGKGTSNDNIYLGFDGDDDDASSAPQSATPQAPPARLSDICALSTTETSGSVDRDMICDICQLPMTRDGNEWTCKCGARRSSFISTARMSVPELKPTSSSQALNSPIDKEFMAKRLESAISSAGVTRATQEVLAASYFDVAVLRCLFCAQWPEEGVHWGLRYIHQRLLEICDERNHVEYTRERSKSLPTPELNIDLGGSMDRLATTPPTPVHRSPTPDPSKLPPTPTEPPATKEHRKEPSFKRIRVAEIKHMIGDKVKSLRRRESMEQFDLDNISQKSGSGRGSPENPTPPPISHDALTVNGGQPPRPSSALGKLTEDDIDSCTEEDKASSGSSCDIVRRKSMPSLRRHKNYTANEDDEDSSGSGSAGLSKPSNNKGSPVSRTTSLKPEALQKPIITITQDSPTPTPSQSVPSTPGWRKEKRESICSDRSAISDINNISPGALPTLHRSATDSDIKYDCNDEIEEVPGSVFYIQSNGQLNYFVVLQAVHAVAKRQSSSKVCGVILNILNCLMDLEIIEKKDNKKTQNSELNEDLKNSFKTDKKDDSEKSDKKEDAKKAGEKTGHNLAMETIIRVYHSLGCPHGCGDGYRGSEGDHLRLQGNSCMTRLMKMNPTEFRKFLRNNLMKTSVQELIDFLHAFLGFCVDPCANLYSPQGQGPKKGSSDGKTGYASNFGQPHGGASNVESQLMVTLLKPLVSKFMESSKELHNHENIGLYCDVRQFLNYVKETHGGTFRCVALSGLIDALHKTTTTTMSAEKSRPMQKMMSRRSLGRRSITVSENGDEGDIRATLAKVAASVASSDEHGAKSRRSLFRRKTKKPQLPAYSGGVSDSELLEESAAGSHLSPRVSMSAAEDNDSAPSTPKRKFSKLNIAWIRNQRWDHDDDSASESGHGADSKSVESVPTQQSPVQPTASSKSASTSSTSSSSKTPRMSFRAAGQATLSLLSARKRLEDGLKNLKRRASSTSKREEGEGSRRSSHEKKESVSTEVVITREKKLVNSFAVKSGMFRFSFMLDCCHPGSVPDPHLMAALLDLEAPVVGRASIFLECAMFVNRCNRGDWPNWMKLNLPSFRQTGLLNSRSQPSGYRRNLILQRAAGRMFHQWGEAIGNRMWDILHEEAQKTSVLQTVKDESKKRELRTEDEEEDFLDEATVNQNGSECPYALKMVACQLLYEITTFLRETYQYIPKTRSARKDGGMGGASGGGGATGTSWDKHVASNRRWSSVLSSPGHSERSNSRSSQGDVSHFAGERKVSFVVVPRHRTKRSGSVPYVTMNAAAMSSGTSSRSPSDRKISFAVFGQSERSDSIHSSTTTISQMDAVANEGRRGVASNRKLLRNRRESTHNASFRRSFKLPRGESGGSIKRLGSSKSRKVSTQSLASERSDDDRMGGAAEGDTEADQGALSDEPQESPDVPPENDEQDYSKYMPWIKTVVQLSNTSNFICEHQSFCHPNCYERQRRSCSRLITAVKKVYGSEPGQDPTVQRRQDRHAESRDNFREKLKRRDDGSKKSEESFFHPSSPSHRRESTPLLEKMRADININRAKILAALEKKDEKKKPAPPKHDPPMIKYINTQARQLTQSSLSIINKAAPILADDTFTDMMPVAWELLMESDQELSAAAASVFLLSSVKVPRAVQELMAKELQHDDVNQRLLAVLRYQALWRARWQVWPRMEDGANMSFKCPPPNIDFVLPSPTIGLPMVTVVDPPWQPHLKTKVQEVALNQEESKSIMTATTTRRKQQQEMIHRALLAEEDRRRAARQNFHMMAVPVNQHAAYEPALHHVGEEHEEVLAPVGGGGGLQDELAAAAARRMSVAPPPPASGPAPSSSRASTASNMRGAHRHSAVYWPSAHRASSYCQPPPEGEEERVEHVHAQHIQTAQAFFTSCVCAAALPIIHLLEDLEVNADGIAVSEVAEKVITQCLTEEPSLFLRTFLEKLTNKDKQEELVFLLRKLLFHMRDLPSQTAHSLFNYLVGFVMFYVRSPAEGGIEAIGEAMSILWQTVPSVKGVFFKDLKQTLRKEQCDPSMLITANVPSAKKLIVHGPDLSCIPSQFPIHEDTQFEHILVDSLDFFNIDEPEHPSYFLTDTKTNEIHNLNAYVRDFYFFRRNFYPQLSLVKMDPEQATQALKKQAFGLKFVEMGKVQFATSILNGTPTSPQQQHCQRQNHVSFLHEELLKLPSFPRKALEVDFCLHVGENGKALFGLDVLHKYVWTKLMARMFDVMSSTTTLEGDLLLFLSVINGTLLLHCEDAAMLRFCLGTYINAARHFKQVFSTTGFLSIMPGMLKIYSSHQANPVILESIEFACRQFFLLHRNPFMLQMFGSVAPILDLEEGQGDIDCNKVQPSALFTLLLSLEKDLPDTLQILELVDGDKPLMALDFCYIDEPDTFSIIEAINMCVTVIAYACDSVRAIQMLTILEAILPFYLCHVKRVTTRQDHPGAAREELSVLGSVAMAMRALITSTETLARNFSGLQRQMADAAEKLKPTANHHGNHSPPGASIYYDEVSDIKFMQMEEGGTQAPPPLPTSGGRKGRHPASPAAAATDDAELSLAEFRRPRASLLCVVAEFFSHVRVRERELRRLLADPSVRAPELLDANAHIKLADVANTLLKVSPFDPVTMKCNGLQRFMLDILPITDWSHESVRPALNMVLRRLERAFSKLYKKPMLRRQLDWDAAANLLKGVYATLARFHYIAHLPHLKTLINVTLNIVLSDESGLVLSDSYNSVHGGGGGSGGASGTSGGKLAATPGFSSAVIKLCAMQMQALGDQFSLEHICGGTAVFPTPEKTINLLINLILPLCIRMGCGRRDAPKMRPQDISFALTVLLNALYPPGKQLHPPPPSSTCGGTKVHYHLAVGGAAAAAKKRERPGPRDSLLTVAFLGLRVLMVSYEKQLSAEWGRIATTIQDLGNRVQGGLPLWRFIDYSVTSRTPLLMHLQPFIQYKMLKVTCETEAEYFLQHLVHQKLQGLSLPPPRSKGCSLIDLATELRHLKEELLNTPTFLGDVPTLDLRRPSTMPRSSSIHDLLEHQMQQRLMSLAPVNSLSGKRFGGKEGLNPNALAPSLLSVNNLSSRESSAKSSITSSQGPVDGFLHLDMLAASGLVNPSPASTGTSIPPGLGSMDSDTSALNRKASHRISALEGSRILDRFYAKQASTVQDGEEGEAAPLRHRPLHRLQRQASIYQKAHVVKQASVCSGNLEEVDEGKEDTKQNGHDLPNQNGYSSASPSLQRRRVIRRRAGTETQTSEDPPTPVLPPTGQQQYTPPPTTSPQCTVLASIGPGGRIVNTVVHGSCNGYIPASDRAEGGGENKNNSSNHVRRCFIKGSGDSGGESPPTLTSTETRPHKLQRADAKSRKTFKIKRNRSTIKGNILRSATMKGSINTARKTPLGKTSSNETTPGFTLLERMETQLEENSGEENAEKSPCKAPKPAEAEDAPATKERASSVPSVVTVKEPTVNGTMEAVGVEVTPPPPPPPFIQQQLSTQAPRKLSKKRYLPAKAKSHDAPDEALAGTGTARARIARSGARLMRSRSPSQSPSRLSQRSTSPSAASAAAPSAQSQAYVAKCDSVESLNGGENAALLKKEEKSRSQSSLLIIFDENDLQDTVV